MINMGAMPNEGYTSRSFPDQSGDLSCEKEIDGINHSTFAGAIGTPDDKILSVKLERSFLYSPDIVNLKTQEIH